MFVLECLSIPVQFQQITDTQSLMAIAFACAGLIITIFTMVIFIKNNNTPVVKSSTRELSYLIFIAMCLCYITTFPLVVRPTKAACYLTRILPGLSFAMIYGALLTKTNRIARVLAVGKKKIITKKLKFMSGTAQVIISFILIFIEVVIIVIVLILEPADATLTYPTPKRVVLVCNTKPLGVMGPFGFAFFLIGMCTIYAIKTRNVPENFNEAKFIGFCMYTTCVIWLAFVPIYFGSDSKVITLCLCISLSALVALVLLFFPKLYIIVLRPERNNRSFFTTAKSVRCHIGRGQSDTLSRNSTTYSISDPVMVSTDLR